MVLTVAAIDSGGMVGIWILGRADLRLRFFTGIWCPLCINCGHIFCACSRGLMGIMVMAMAMVMVMG